MFTGISKEICEMAWQIVLPSITRAAGIGVSNKLAGTVVVLDPWSGELLFTAQVNPEHPDAEKYDEIAAAKAAISWEAKLPSRKVQQDAPNLYRIGMTKWGGAVIENNQVVSFSGVQAVFDEAIAWSMLKWIVAMCQHEMTREGGVMERKSSYIGQS